MIAAKDYYKTLGVSENASLDDIKKAYRNLALKYHPDRASTDKKKDAEERFKEISEAYYVLSNKERRSEYDGYRNGAGRGFKGDFAEAQGFDFDEILKHFGGPRSAKRQSRRNRSYSGIFDFDEIFDIFDSMGENTTEHYVFNSEDGRNQDSVRNNTDIHAKLNVPLRLLTTGGEAKFRHDGKELILRINPGTKRGQKLRLKSQGRICPCCSHPGDLIVTII